MPRTLGAALLGGAAEYMRGRNARGDREEAEWVVRDRNRIADERTRMDDDRYQTQMAASAEQMRAQRERQAAMDARQSEMDRMGAAREGMVETGRVQGDLQGLLGDAAPSIKGPTYQIGGQSYTKARRSDADVEREQAQQARASERAQDQAARASEAATERQWRTQEAAKERASNMAEIGARLSSQPTGARLRAVPAGTMKDFQGIQANLRELQDIEAALTADPRSADEALGLRNKLPEWAATRGMSDPALTLRGKMSNIASGIFLERSGAAVTPSEAQRLQGWTANLTDNPKKALNAIRNMRAFYEQKVADMQGAYGEETGYRPLTPSERVAPAGAPPSRPPLSSFMGRR